MGQPMELCSERNVSFSFCECKVTNYLQTDKTFGAFFSSDRDFFLFEYIRVLKNAYICRVLAWSGVPAHKHALLIFEM